MYVSLPYCLNMVVIWRVILLFNFLTCLGDEESQEWQTLYLIVPPLHFLTYILSYLPNFGYTFRLDIWSRPKLCSYPLRLCSLSSGPSPLCGLHIYPCHTMFLLASSSLGVEFCHLNQDTIWLSGVCPNSIHFIETGSEILLCKWFVNCTPWSLCNFVVRGMQVVEAEWMGFLAAYSPS